MKRSKYQKRKKYYGKGAKDLIRPTLNKGRIFVGEGLLTKRYRKRKSKKVYRRGIFSSVLLGSLVPTLLNKIL